MDKSERGAGSSEVFVIIAFVVYFLFMGYLGNAAGYTTHIIGNLSGWQLPHVNTGVGWLTGTIDFFEAILNIFAWLVGALVSYVALIGFSVTGGNIPSWVIAFLFTPLAFGMGWMVISLLRGRE